MDCVVLSLFVSETSANLEIVLAAFRPHECREYSVLFVKEVSIKSLVC